MAAIIVILLVSTRCKIAPVVLACWVLTVIGNGRWSNDWLNSCSICGGARTNLKVGCRGTCRKNCRWCASNFLALKAQLVVLVSAFVMVSAVFFIFIACCYSTHGATPRAQTFVKVGARAPVPYKVGPTQHLHNV